jgi:hypothetical protein
MTAKKNMLSDEKRDNLEVMLRFLVRVVKDCIYYQGTTTCLNELIRLLLIHSINIFIIE